MTDGQEAGQAGFRGQQVVIAFVATAIAHVETHGQQLPLRVEEKAKIHRGESPAKPGKKGDLLQFVAGCQGGSAGRLPHALWRRLEPRPQSSAAQPSSSAASNCQASPSAICSAAWSTWPNVQPASSRSNQAYSFSKSARSCSSSAVTTPSGSCSRSCTATALPAEEEKRGRVIGSSRRASVLRDGSDVRH